MRTAPTAITSATGALVQRLSYDPFGRPRTVNGTDTPTNLSPDVRRGFTGHEMLPEAGGLIHMNGRMYDPQLGRFLSADFLIPNGEHTESYNRYSYVFNNPLSLTDPDGQCPVCAIVVVIIGGAATYTATTIAATIVMSSFFGMMAAAVATEGDPKAMLQGAVSGALFAWIGGAIQHGAGAGGALTGGQIAAKIAVHAVAGGLINSAFGGDFRSGALAGGFGAAVGSMSGLQINEYSGWGQVIAVGVIRTVAGGIGAELGGGKFVNGAATAAFAYLFNDVRGANGKDASASKNCSEIPVCKWENREEWREIRRGSQVIGYDPEVNPALEVLGQILSPRFFPGLPHTEIIQDMQLERLFNIRENICTACGERLYQYDTMKKLTPTNQYRENFIANDGGNRRFGNTEFGIPGPRPSLQERWKLP